MPLFDVIPAFFPTEFSTNWEHLCQQAISKLRDMVIIDKVNGKEKSYNQMAPVEMTQITTKAATTNITDTALAKRWLRPLQYEKADLFDEWDAELLGQIALPTSEVVKNHANAYSRALDKIICQAAVGTAFTGDTGTTAVALPNAQKIGATFVESGTQTTSGLTIAKLREAKFRLDDAETNEDEERILVCSGKQIQDLLREDKATSADYNSVKALVAGHIDTFMGFRFKRVNKSFLAFDAGTSVRSCFAYVRSGIRLTDAGRKVYVDVRPDRSHSLQLRTTASIGAARMEEVKVVQIDCDEVI